MGKSIIRRKEPIQFKNFSFRNFKNYETGPVENRPFRFAIKSAGGEDLNLQSWRTIA